MSDTDTTQTTTTTPPSTAGTPGTSNADTGNIALKYGRDQLDTDHQQIASQLESLLKAYPHILKEKPQDVQTAKDFYADIKKNDLPAAQALFNSLPDASGAVSLIEMYPGGKTMLDTFRTAKAAGQVAGSVAGAVGTAANLTGKSLEAATLPVVAGWDFVNTIWQRMGNTISDKNAEQFATLYASASQVEKELRESGTPIDQALRHPGATLSASGSSLVDIIKHISEFLGKALGSDFVKSLPVIGPLLAGLGGSMESWGATASDQSFQQRVDAASAGEDKKQTANAIHDARPDFDAINAAVLNGYIAAADDGTTTTVNPAVNGQAVPSAPAAAHDTNGNTVTPTPNLPNQGGSALGAAWQAAGQDFNNVYGSLGPGGKLLVGTASSLALGAAGKKLLPPAVRSFIAAKNAAPGAIEALSRHMGAATLETTAHVVGRGEWSQSQKLAQKLEKNLQFKADYEQDLRIAKLKAEALELANPKMGKGWWGHKTELGKTRIEIHNLETKIKKLDIEDRKGIFGGKIDGLKTHSETADEELQNLRDKKGLFRDFDQLRLNTADGLLQKATTIRTSGVLSDAPVVAATATTVVDPAAAAAATASNIVTPPPITKPVVKPRASVWRPGRAGRAVSNFVSTTVAQVTSMGNNGMSGATALQDGAQTAAAANDMPHGHISFDANGSPLKLQPALDVAPLATGSGGKKPPMLPTTTEPHAPIAHAANDHLATHSKITNGAAQVSQNVNPASAANNNVPQAQANVPAAPTTADVSNEHVTPPRGTLPPEPPEVPHMRSRLGALGPAGVVGISGVINGGLAAANGGNVGDIAKATGVGIAEGALPGVTNGFKNITQHNAHQNTLDQWLNGASTATQGAAVVSGAAAVVTSETVVGGIGFGIIAGVSEVASLGIGVAHDVTYWTGISKQGGLITGVVDTGKAYMDSKAGQHLQAALHTQPAQQSAAAQTAAPHPGLAGAVIVAHMAQARAQAMQGATPMVAHNVQLGALHHPAGSTVPVQTVGAKVAGVGHIPQPTLQHA